MSSVSPENRDRPLNGVTVLDLTRMLPGAALARQLLALGACVIKVEDPVQGDPLRHAPPLEDGIGAGFRAFYAGAQSVALDLREAADAAKLRSLARQADVLVESFRPGTLARWGLPPESLMEVNPRLVVCSLPAYAAASDLAGHVGHDLNFIARSGLLAALGVTPGSGVPVVQLADLGASMLAASAVLAALWERERTGRGRRVEQSLMSGALAFMPWLYANASSPDPDASRVPTGILAGRCPSYRVYACADGKALAVAAIEPKFWKSFLEMLGLPELAAVGTDLGPQGALAAGQIASRLAERPRAWWLDEAGRRGLPVSPVHEIADALQDAVVETEAALAIGPWHIDSSATVPRLGQDTERVI